MNKVLFLFIAGIFVGATIFELKKRSKTKWEFIHLLEHFIEKEADDLALRSLAKDEEKFISDFKPVLVQGQ
jgi:hypothetical protein